jgi:two-component system, chemotaxis family, chemotaxis protein CheY
MPRRKSQLILIIDDTATFRSAIREVLVAHRYRVDEAQSGRTALDLLAGGLRPDFILLDLVMPQMSGWQFMEALRGTEWETIPIVITSAQPEGGHIRPGQVRGYLQKPTTIDALLDSIRH